MLKFVTFINELKCLSISHIMNLSFYLYLRNHEKKLS